MSGLIYLAGPITGLTYDEATDWRDEAAPALHALGFRTASPMRGKEHLKGAGVLSGVFDEGKAAVERDRWDIEHSDIVLANFTGAKHVSIGTCCEIGYAYALRKHIVTVMPTPTASATVGENSPRPEDNPHDHIFIQEWSSIILASFADALTWLREMRPADNAWWNQPRIMMAEGSVPA